MAGQLVEHVVKETQPGVHVHAPSAVQVQVDGNFGFVSISGNGGFSVRQAQKPVNLIPVGGGEGGQVMGGLIQENSPAAQVLRHDQVRDPVADNEGIGQVIVSVEVLSQHTNGRFSGR